jgi:hypothetical protein
MTSKHAKASFENLVRVFRVVRGLNFWPWRNAVEGARPLALLGRKKPAREDARPTEQRQKFDGKRLIQGEKPKAESASIRVHLRLKTSSPVFLW